jgi:hypothetical protein
VVLSRGDFEATRFAAPKLRVPGHVPHLVSHLVLPSPIRVDSHYYRAKACFSRKFSLISNQQITNNNNE